MYFIDEKREITEEKEHDALCVSPYKTDEQNHFLLGQGITHKQRLHETS
jgi:hypothetical protein